MGGTTRLQNAQIYDLVERVRARVLSASFSEEDGEVELKSKWPDPADAARRIAAHANSAEGDVIVWLIGMNQRDGVVRFEPVDLATWTDQMHSRFDGAVPRFRDLLVSTDAGPVHALIFSTSDAPYVIRYDTHEGTKGVTREVPWREGTKVRSANRSELLRMLIPAATSPSIELRDATLFLRDKPAGTGNALLQATIYVEPADASAVVLPLARQSAYVSHDGIDTALPKIELRSRHSAKAANLQVSDDALTIYGIASFWLSAQGDLPFETYGGKAAVDLNLVLSTVGAIRPRKLEASLVGDSSAPGYILEGRPWGP